MFDQLSGKFQQLFSKLGQEKKLTEDNLTDAVRSVRLALLDADVNYSVASRFVKQVKEKALGQSQIKTVSAEHQFSSIVHEELVSLMGSEEKAISFKGSPTVIMLCGLQGSGKTTACAKLAYLMQKKEHGKKVLIAACDLARPAAVLQLKQLGEQGNIAIHAEEGAKKPLKVAKEALKKARIENYDVLIVDTAGRLHIDEPLMEELSEMKQALSPDEIFFVASSTTGQDAVKTALEFDQQLDITGSILTMLDGNSRAGAAISILEVTKKPLRFEGIGEKLDDLQLFNPKSMADRILGMGDVINLVRKAKEHIDEEESEKLEKKIKKAQFTYGDYLQQMKSIKKMGPLKNLLKMMPGLPDLGDLEGSDKEFNRLEAIISSMTPSEREEHVDLIPARRHRIANGSGVKIDEVNRMVKSFKRLKQMMKKMPQSKTQMLKMMGSKEKNLWR